MGADLVLPVAEIIFDGSGCEAERMEATFPFEMTYTLQKYGAPFNTVLGISLLLNNLHYACQKVHGSI